MTMRLIYITAQNRTQAESIGMQLVERRLAACVNILDGMTSIYPWEGKIEKAQEVVLIAKTDAAHVDALIEAVRELHSHTVPCALVLPVLGGNEAYLRWLEEQVK